MTTKKTIKKQTVTKPSKTAPITKPGAPAPLHATLKMFTNGAGSFPGFTFTRAWYEGDGQREGITPWVEKKLTPGEDRRFGAAVHAGLVLPRPAPGEYWSIPYLFQRFDEMLPSFERHAFVHVKLTLSGAEPVHAAFEKVRSFAWQHFAVERRLAALVIVHVPGVAGVSNPRHAHCVIPSRAISADGFMETNYRVCSDTGQQEAWQAWEAHAGRWDAQFA
jgi:hypothetical protein